MKVFAIASLVVFFLMKAVVYTTELFLKRGYVSDYGHMFNVVLPIMSLVTYTGCFYLMGENLLGLAFNFALAWLILIVAILVVKYMNNSFCYITATDNYEGYKVALGVINYLKKTNPDVLYDDNIGISDSIKITYSRRLFSREKMARLIDEEYSREGATKRIGKISLLSFMVHFAELLFDISFLVNVCML